MSIAQPENWRAVQGFPGYEVSDQGRMRSWWVPRHRVIGSAPKLVRLNTSTKYVSACLCRDGKKYSRAVHVLVLEAFVGPRPDGTEARHVNDNDRTNNQLSNLAWGTKLENEADKIRHGTVPRGERHGSRTHPERICRGDSHYARTQPELLARGEHHGQAKLTSGMVLRIFLDRRSQRAIAREHGVDQTTVSQIKRRRKWRHVTECLVIADGQVTVA